MSDDYGNICIIYFDYNLNNSLKQAELNLIKFIGEKRFKKYFKVLIGYNSQLNHKISDIEIEVF